LRKKKIKMNHLRATEPLEVDSDELEVLEEMEHIEGWDYEHEDTE
jgi:hypothetical protein